MASVTSTLCRDRHVGDVLEAEEKGDLRCGGSGTIMTTIIIIICWEEDIDMRYDTIGPSVTKIRTACTGGT